MERKRTSPGHEAIRLDTMLEAVELPARISYLDARLPDMDADDLPHLPLALPASESGCAASGVQRQLSLCTGKKPPKRSAPLHTEEGACGRVQEKKRRQGTVAASTGTFLGKQTATDGLRYTTHVGRKATPANKYH